MANWIEITSPNKIKSDIETIENDINYIIQELNADGYSITPVTLQTISYNTDLATVITVLNNVESELKTLNNNLDFIIDFHRYKWSSATRNKIQRVRAWIAYINELYLIVSGTRHKTSYLVDSNNNFVTDINGNYIVVRNS